MEKGKVYTTSSVMFKYSHTEGEDVIGTDSIIFNLDRGFHDDEESPSVVCDIYEEVTEDIPPFILKEYNKIFKK